MKRLLPAAVIALVCHSLVFFLQPLGTTTPPRLKAARRPVTLNLAHFVPTAPKVQEPPQPPAVTPRSPAVTPPPTAVTPPPRPKPPKPRPQPEQKKPTPKPQLKPEPQPVAPKPVPEETPPTMDKVVSATPPPVQIPRPAIEVAAEVAPGPTQQAPLVEATPLYADNPPPRYPRSARRRGNQGTVLLSVHVTPLGSVDDIKVETSSGFDVLDKAALAAVHTWRFESGRRGDTPVAMWVEVPIRFELK